MLDPETRVAYIIRGVVEQALHDSGVHAIRLVGPPTAQSALIEEWCGSSFVDDRSALAVCGLNKTELLLNGITEFAHITPLGDLYATELNRLGGAGVVSGNASKFASLAGGIAALDSCLRKLLDERYDPDAAFASSPDIQTAVLQRLNETRFSLAGAGIIPKIGARTIGIDLFI